MKTDHFKHSPRRSLCRWVLWFFFFNTLIATFIIMGYIPLFSTLKMSAGSTLASNIFAYIYFILAFFAQMSVYMFICAAICMATALAIPSRTVVLMLAALLSAVVLFVIVLDAVTFRLYHMHYLVVGLQIIKAGVLSEVFALGFKETLLIYGLLAVATVLEGALAAWLWYVFSKPKSKMVTRSAYGAVLGVLLVVYTSFGFAVADIGWHGAYRYAILRSGRIVPYLSQIYLAAFDRNKTGRVLDLAGMQVPVMNRPLDNPLHYPLHPLRCSLKQKPLNIVVIGIDTWRYSSMNKRISPHIEAFSRKSVNFNHHYSGGNCTRPGLFSLFYGLPANYWQAAVKAKQPPVLLNQLKKNNYQVKFFMSAPINFPHFDRTILVNMKSEVPATPGNSSLARDRNITRAFTQFIKNRKDSSQPFFSFLFYDALHNYCEPARPKQNPFQPAAASCDRFSLGVDTAAAPYLNLYNNKVGFIDRQIGRLLASLKQHGLLKNTIVILTADHGEQMNDEGLGLWGHASAYSTYQLHVPMLVYWPGMHPATIHYQTTHYDMVPTLLQRVVGCSNPTRDYALGQSLFERKRQNYFVAGSYGDYALISDKKAFRVYPDGDFDIYTLKGHRKDPAAFQPQVLRQAYADLKLFTRP